MTWTPSDRRLDQILSSLRPLRNLRPRPLARRFRMLLAVVDRWAQPTLDDAAVQRCRSLAAMPWQRPVDAWRGPDVDSLARHLVARVRYPLPDFLWAAALDGTALRFRFHTGQDQQRAMALLSFLGAGGGMAEARRRWLVDPLLSRRACHVLWTLPSATSLEDAERRALVLAGGGVPWLADAVGAFEPPYGRTRRQWGQRLLWLSSLGEQLQEHELVEVLDWLAAQPDVPTARSIARVRREVHEWHGQVATATGRFRNVWLPRAAIDDHTMQTPSGSWHFRQLRSLAELVEEGRALRHCVATYAGKVQRKASAIFGLRCDGQRRLTIEVSRRTLSVIQAKGSANRLPTKEERLVLEAWCRRVGLTIERT
ncbi:MAG: PcfJ domain-containing protein [Myxococcales bacterium]|nr:PcfJ domain-containing protein [Myxococcales bacterium]